MTTSFDERKFFEQFENFTAEEMSCKCGKCSLPIEDPEFIDFMWKFQRLRTKCDFPFHINSGYRCPEYNRQIYVIRAIEAGLPEPDPGKYLDGPHTKGGADVGVSFERNYKLQKEAFNMNMGVGAKQHGPIGRRYVHVDGGGMRSWTYS